MPSLGLGVRPFPSPTPGIECRRELAPLVSSASYPVTCLERLRGKARIPGRPHSVQSLTARGPQTYLNLRMAHAGILSLESMMTVLRRWHRGMLHSSGL